MPPKKTKGKGRGKGALAAQMTNDCDSERPQGDADVTSVAEVTGEEEEDVSSRMETDEKIAEFFEERPFYYDQGNADYKNKQRRNTDLAELARNMGHGHTG